MKEKLKDFFLWLAGYTALLILILWFGFIVVVFYLKYKLMRGA